MTSLTTLPNISLFDEESPEFDMPDPKWEEASKPEFYGYLKFSDFQAAGYDLHATFEKKDKRVHVSVYQVQKNSKEKKITLEPPVYMEVIHSGLFLNVLQFSDIKIALGLGFGEFPHPMTGDKDYEEFFLRKCNEKYVALGIGTEKPKDVVAEFKLNNYSWPLPSETPKK